MISQIIRKSALPSTRWFSLSVKRNNIIQDLYLKELKSIKLQPINVADAHGSVKPWTEPCQPKLPELELGASGALKSYSEMEVETIQENTSSEGAEIEVGDWLVLEELEDDHKGH